MIELKDVKTLIPIESLEIEAQTQIHNERERDFNVAMAIMPDCHTGYTLPIGGVVVSDNVISSQYTGFDIGCGVCSVITDIDMPNWSYEEKVKIQRDIMAQIPVGFNSREVIGVCYSDFKSASGNKELNKKVNDKISKQLGTLGSGNHFIEIGTNKDNKLAITIHSGSRNSGHSVADFYMKLKDGELPTGFFHLDSELGESYLFDMSFMLEYALANRMNMMKHVFNVLEIDIKKFRVINENHNHAEVYDGGSLVLHRKGATPAMKGQLGVIPGNMRDGVYITVGRGNEEFLSSASHGAGRTMSRGKAKKSISLELFQEQMKGVVGIVNSTTLDEAPDAYKNIGDVINAQRGIVVDIIDHIKPVINIKG